MKSVQPKFSFFESFVIETLKKSGVGVLSAANEAAYLPQLVSEAELRMGLALMPLLAEPATEAFAELSADETTTPVQWEKFWKTSVPDFEGVVTKTLQKFALDCKKILAR